MALIVLASSYFYFLKYHIVRNEKPLKLLRNGLLKIKNAFEVGKVISWGM